MPAGTRDDAEKRYDAFISYSHAATSRTAEQLQRALQTLAKPWYRLRSMRVFRDETDLSAAPELWPTIQSALAQSRFLLLMASERAATSKWVAKELAYWLEHRSADTLLIALTDGDIVWDNERGDFDWRRTTALPKQISGAFRGEPLWVDLRWTSTHQNLTLRNPEFLRAAARLAAPIRQLDLAALVSEDHRQHRRTLRVAYGAAAALVIFLLIAVWQFQSSLAAADRERDQSVLASVANAYQVLYLDPLQAVDQAHNALRVKRTPEGEAALRLAMEVGAHRLRSRQEEGEVLGSGVGYLMERWRQGEVFTKLRKDGRYALVATERGKDGPDPPGKVYLISLDDRRTTELQAGDDASGRRLEYAGFSSSGEEVFVARQFYLDIYDLAGNRTESVQLEYHAKPTHLIAGMLGSYVLVGDTVGHVMLADTASPERPQLRGSRYPDAALFFEADASGTRAIVIFESGRADLVGLDDPTSPVEHELAPEGVVHASFGPRPYADRLLTASETGQVEVWRFDGEGLTRLASFDQGDVPVGLASFSSDGTRIICLGGDGTYRIWDIEERGLIASYPQGAREVSPAD